MKTTRSHALGGALLLCALTSTAPGAAAQALVYEAAGCSTLVRIHDLNLDGVDDIAVGLQGASRVFLVSGSDGATLRVMRRAGGFGAALQSVDDMDGDGVRDLLVGAPTTLVSGSPRGAVHLVSLGTGTTLWVSQGLIDGDHLGTSVAMLPDLDGDGVPEVAAGAPQFPLFEEGVNGRVLILDGATGERVGALRPEGLPASFEAAQFGASLALLGDVDDDGLDDLAVGMPGFVFSGPGAVTVHSSAGLLGPQEPAQLTMTNGRAEFGAALVNAGDLDGDLLDDVLVGSPEGVGPGDSKGGGLAFSGADGSLLMTVTAAGNAAGLGEAVAAPGDLDQDGWPDLMVAGRGTFFVPDSRVVMAVSGATGDVLFEHASPSVALENELKLGSPGDVTGDGRPEFAVSDCTQLVMQLQSLVAVWSDLGFGLPGPGGVPLLTGTGDPSGDDPLQVQVTGASPDVGGVFFAGSAYGGTAFKNGTLVPVPEFAVEHVHTDGAGAWSASFPWDAEVLGSEVWVQVWFDDPSAPRGVSATNGVQASGT